MEVLVLALVALSPWALGSADPELEFFVLAAIGLLTVLWAGRILLTGTFTWRSCPLTLCLAGLFLLGALQLAPLPAGLSAWLAPGNREWLALLLPRQPEVLPDGGVVSAPLPAGSALSLYPAGTRLELVRLLALILLFAAVRNNVAGPGAFRRLAVVCLLNGALLGLFAFLQLFSSRRNLLYWTIPAPVPVFGPFICRNHFPFYVNVCLGLGVGLLVSLTVKETSSRSSRRRHGRREEVDFASISSPGVSWVAQVGDFLNHPTLLWVVVALTLAASSVLFSLSRGGLLGLLAGSVVFILLLRIRQTATRVSGSGGALRLLGVGLTLLLGLGLLTWFGLDPLEKRLGTILQGDVFQDSRVTLWSDSLRAAREFPLLGSGLGTFVHVEMAYRSSSTNTIFDYDHAHNEYLEALVEGGIPRLLVLLIGIVFVYLLGWRALKRYAGSSTAPLVLGGLFAFTTVVIHSIVDFGIHNASIAALVTVLCAHLAALGAAEDEARRAPAAVGSTPLLRRGMAGVAALTGLLLAWVVTTEGWRQGLSQSLRMTGYSQLGNLAQGVPDRAAREGFLKQMLKAVAVAPQRAELHMEAAQGYFALFELALDLEQGSLVAAGCVLASSALVAAPGMPGAQALFDPFVRLHPRRTRPKESAEMVQDYLEPGLRHVLLARDLCPLIARTHLRLAALCRVLRQADPASVYLARAKRLLAFDPELWYLAGQQEMAAGQREEGLNSWRQSLQLSDRFLGDMVAQTRDPRMTTELLERVIPDRAQAIMAVLDRLYPKSDPYDDYPYPEDGKPYLERALRALAGPLVPADLYLKSRVLFALGQTAEAQAACQEAVKREPRQIEWRLRLARYLYDDAKLEEARSQLQILLAQHPNSEQQEKAQIWLQLIQRDLKD
jgi:hypothetical protein